MESSETYWSDLAALDWQVELGADEATLERPVNRYELEVAAPKPKEVEKEPALVAETPNEIDPVQVAREAADAASSLEALAAAQSAYEHCELKKGARNFVFSDGVPGARVMIVGEAPGRNEDLEGKPFVGQAGQLLDKMFDAINMGRDRDADAAIYIANILPWRPPSNRTPDAAEMAMMLPFVERHITLANPDILVLMGNTPCQALLGRAGITRLRGQWQEVLGRPTLPIFHPAYLLRQPAAKREAWADLLSLQARLRG